MINRRTFLHSAAATATLVALGIPIEAIAANRVKFGSASPFSFDTLIAQAKALAQKPYQPQPTPPRAILDRIDYAAHGQIKYKTDYALFADGPGQFPVTFFHLGRFFQLPVHMYLIDEKAPKAREIIYDESYFDMPNDSPARELPRGSGFSGFRFQESRRGDQENSIGIRTIGWPFSVPLISAPSVICISMAYRRGDCHRRCPGGQVRRISKLHAFLFHRPGR